jgi:hypothetical protein
MLPLRISYGAFSPSLPLVAVNVSRLNLMGLSEWHFQTAHNQWGDMLSNTLILGLAVGISVIGVRRKLFSST